MPPTAQGTRVELAADGAAAEPTPARQLVLCANNYLGLAQHPALAQAAASSLLLLSRLPRLSAVSTFAEIYAHAQAH